MARILTESEECGPSQQLFMVTFEADTHGKIPNATEAKALIDAALAAQPHFESTCVKVSPIYMNDVELEDELKLDDDQLDLFN